MKGRRLRILRQLGEGGYSYVYLVRDVTAQGAGGGLQQQESLFALKRIWAVTEEQLQEQPLAPLPEMQEKEQLLVLLQENYYLQKERVLY